MKDKLKEFFEQNRSQFDHQNPADGIWERIQSNLWPVRTQLLWNSVSLWRAAALVLFSLSAYLIVDKLSVPITSSQKSIQSEYADLEVFYKEQISQKVAMLASYDESSRYENELADDFIKLEAMHQVLNEQMQCEPSEKLKDALILNFLVRIDLLNQQLQEVESTIERKDDPISI